MAEHKHGDMNVKEQEKTFDGFMTFSMRIIIAIIVVLVLMGIFLTF